MKGSGIGDSEVLLMCVQRFAVVAMMCNIMYNSAVSAIITIKPNRTCHSSTLPLVGYLFHLYILQRVCTASLVLSFVSFTSPAISLNLHRPLAFLFSVETPQKKPTPQSLHPPYTHTTTPHSSSPPPLHSSISPTRFPSPPHDNCSPHPPAHTPYAPRPTDPTPSA